LRRHAFRLPSHPASVGIARLRVRDHLRVWGRGHDSVEPVILVVSELATNAIRHGPGPARDFEVAVTVLPDGSCVVEVSDPGRTPPVLCDPDEAAESGRGLRLVAALAEVWGVRHRGRLGKTVWAVLRPGPGSGSASGGDNGP
jgi:two-component sensor histidine kinase